MLKGFLHITVTHGVKYLAASLIAGGTTLIMTKYYTAVFTPEEYGILALYLVMFKYIVTISGLTLDSTSTRFYFDYRETKRDEYLSTIFWFITILSTFTVIIGLIFMNSISTLIASNTKLVYLVTMFAGICAVYVSFLTRVLYNEQKSTSVLKHTVLQTFINHILSIFLISYFHLGIFGRMSGQGLGYFFNIFSLISEFSKKKLFNIKMIFNKAMAKETFLLALPSIISVLLSVAFIYLDRIFLKYYIGDSAVGIYTLGYMLGQGLSMIYEAISQAILPKVYNDMNHDYEKARDELEYFSYRYYFSLIIITIVISTLSPIIVAIFSNESYSEAANVMPFVMAGFMMGGFYKIPALVLGFHKIVWFYPFLAIFAFGTNALLNWWLIPIYGMIGSAFASFVGVFIYSSFMQYKVSKYLSSKYISFTFILYLFVFITNLGVFYG